MRGTSSCDYLWVPQKPMMTAGIGVSLRDVQNTHLTAFGRKSPTMRMHLNRRLEFDVGAVRLPAAEGPDSGTLHPFVCACSNSPN